MSSQPLIRQRKAETLNVIEGLHPVLQRVYQNRGVLHSSELDRSLKSIPHFNLLSGIEKACVLLTQHIQQDSHLLIVADFDADGATACAVAYRGLKMLGAKNVDYIVPDRAKYGYGLTPEIAQVALKKQPDLIITVDNGISSVEGVNVVKQGGCDILITDHHLPPQLLPLADAIVNPQVNGDAFPSKAIAGVGVMFYVLLALKSHLVKEGILSVETTPNLTQLLDLVALGTVADVVPLDALNRRFVYQGLLRIQQGDCAVGIKALLSVAQKKQHKVQASDMGFALGPRLNAAGRLEDMSTGIRCLITDDETEAYALAQRLNELNLKRRDIEQTMKDSAFKALEQLKVDVSDQWSLCLFQKDWHQGVVGILASRLKEKFNRPTIIFAPGEYDEIKGSARSISGLHIRDALDDIASQSPQLLTKFGGHAMAAGLSIKKEHFEIFREQFESVVKKRLNNIKPTQEIWVDGEINDVDLTMELTKNIQSAGPWGQQFSEPQFSGRFIVKSRKIIGEKHVKLQVLTSLNHVIDAIYFNPENIDEVMTYRSVQMVYRLSVNDYFEQERMQLLVTYLEPLDA